jgi:hypothetical protein
LSNSSFLRGVNLKPWTSKHSGGYRLFTRMCDKMQNELKQVTPAQIKDKAFKAVTVVEDKNKILIFFDDGTFTIEHKSKLSFHH